MRKLVLMLSIALCLGAAKPGLAGWHSEYTGTLGDKEIGLTIIKEKPFSKEKKFGDSILATKYYYREQLEDIPLKQKSHAGRDIVLEEYDAENNLRGAFKLSFQKQDPKGILKSKDDLQESVLTGTWQDTDGNEQAVYLRQTHGVTGEVDGGRCWMTADRYKEVQNKIKRFHAAVMNKNAELLRTEFNYEAPTSERWLKSFSETTPHNMFCNYKGLMLGRGLVWFDPDGNVIQQTK